MALYPAGNDAQGTLVFKIAQNWYEIAVKLGITGLNAPIVGQTQSALYSLICYYTAVIDQLNIPIA
jgi:hypothetical protein